MAKLALAVVLLTAGCVTSDPPLSAGGQPTVSTLRRAPGGKASSRLLNGVLHPFGSGGWALQRPARRADRDEQRAPILNWPALANCESGGNPRAVDPTGRYFGLYQAALPTWRAAWLRVGRPDIAVLRPDRASPVIQIRFAQLLYADRGGAPWPYCRRYL